MRIPMLFLAVTLTMALTACTDKKETTAIPENAVSDTLSDSTQPKKPEAQIESDTVTFVQYNDDGDYFFMLVQKNNSSYPLIYDWENSGAYDFHRGDVLQVTWKNDTITIAGDNESREVAAKALTARKIKDGAVSKFRKQHPNPLKYTYTEDLTDSFRDKLYLLTEYYIANSKDPLVALMAKNPKAAIQYSIEKQQRDSKEYYAIGISNGTSENKAIFHWLYIDPEEMTLYDYDLPNDKLHFFP